jgi:hypothetical protein
MCFENPSTPTPNTGMGQTLAAEVKYAPQVYAANAAYSPLYTQLDLSNLNSFLGGQNGQPGFLSTYENTIMPDLTSAQTAANTQIRQANLTDAAALTPQYISEERAANPGAAGLLDTLTSNANQQLSYGTQLTPAEQLQMNQSVRGGEAARGLGYGPSDVFNESMADTNYGQQLYQQRMGEAQGLVPTLQGFYGNPTAAISGMDSNAGMSAGSLASFGGSSAASAQSNEFNPQTDLTNIMSNQLAVSEDSAMNNNAGISMGVDAGSGALNGVLGAMKNL